MIVTVAPSDTKCTAMVLTDPADPKSPTARCCRVWATWEVRPKYGVGLSGAACPSHVNILLTEVAPTEGRSQYVNR
jgi:hypothetical protein